MSNSSNNWNYNQLTEPVRTWTQPMNTTQIPVNYFNANQNSHQNQHQNPHQNSFSETRNQVIY